MYFGLLYLCICVLCICVFVYLCICVFVYLYAERRAPVKGVDYTKAGGERGLGHCDSGLD